MKAIELLGFSYFHSRLFDGYKLPGVNVKTDGIVGTTIFTGWADLVLHLSRFGFPYYCNFATVAPEEMFDLECYLATCTYKILRYHG
jgi:hypothetical protein